MQKWTQIFQKNTGLNPYIWVILYILPFYFIFDAPFSARVIVGIVLILAFFVFYILTLVAKGGSVYVWISLQLALSLTMILFYSYVYFALFLALFIGNIKSKAGFISLYIVNIVTTVAAINYGFVTQTPLFITQFPFVLVCLIGVIVLPINMYNKNKQDKLEGQLEDANKRISELVKQEERQRIAKDLHDTLGQKLSLIGLKIDLAGKLIESKPEQAREELQDVRQTTRSALKEVRELVTEMRGTRLDDALFRAKQMLKAAEIECQLEGEAEAHHLSLMNENVASMCVLEAVTNIVKHSNATQCNITLEATASNLMINIKDNGVGLPLAYFQSSGGIRGMKERLEFINGSIGVSSDSGTALQFRIPYILNQVKGEA